MATKPPSEASIEAEVSAAVDRLNADLPPEILAVLRAELKRGIIESTEPAAAVRRHIKELYSTSDGGYKVPDGNPEAKAMVLLAHHLWLAKGALENIRDWKRFSCSHERLYTSDRSHSEVSTRAESAAHALKVIRSQKIEGEAPGETNDQIEAHINRWLDRSFGYPNETDQEARELIGNAYRTQLLASTDPSTVLRRRLSRYEQPDGTIAIPDSERLDRAIHLILVQLGHGLASLEVIASGKLSCEAHEKAYAGGVESPGNLLYTPQKVAADGLGDIEAIVLEPLKLNSKGAQ